ncbi:hypothetical protein DY000_02041219 [Brassica cretica]|uniref:RNase H type-1 domain-containing protein n=1 Tax=Brassica cretica TaxID=69181 RepID=A0ABQ7BEQ3_BRACR|nr:hypothetical protein DY000_02041219 [Brassica cretica]
MGTRNITRCESALHSEVEALRWAMDNMLQHSPCQRFGTDCKELIAMLRQLGPFVESYFSLVVLFRSGYADHLKLE